MLVIPRLELVGGACARIPSGGALGSDDPVAVARAWAAEGFSRLHLVDRDAVAGRGSNLGVVESICRDVGVDADVSAGINAAEQIEAFLDAGAARVVLGARALTEEDWLQSAADAFPGALVVETTVRERRVQVRGWVRTLPFDLLDLADELADVPIGGLLVTAPAGAAPELALLEDLAEACRFPLMVEDARPTVSALRAFEHRGVGAVVIPGAALVTELDSRSIASEFGR